MRTHISERQTVRIPTGLHRRWDACLRRRNHVGSALLLCWLREAVIDARVGRPVPLEVGRQRRVSGDGGDVVARWTQSSGEYAAWEAELAAVGSSPRAVLRARVTEYVAAADHPLVMVTARA